MSHRPVQQRVTHAVCTNCNRVWPPKTAKTVRQNKASYARDKKITHHAMRYRHKVLLIRSTTVVLDYGR